MGNNIRRTGIPRDIHSTYRKIFGMEGDVVKMDWVALSGMAEVMTFAAFFPMMET
jgi:hypothetical protein